MQFVEQADHAPKTGRPGDHRYGPAVQVAVRRVERAARQSAVVFSRWAHHRGASRQHVAVALGRTVRTVASWEQGWQVDHLNARPRGRPTHGASVEQRNQVIATLVELGPHTGVPVCQGVFLGLARRQVEDIVHRFKRVEHKRRRRGLARLTWRQPGTVWAMDHSYPPTPICDRRPDALAVQQTRILAVRDLASGYQLAFDPVPDESAEQVVGVLVLLFLLYGPPLVIKADNGGAFDNELVRTMLTQWAVVLLLSPVRRPQYNGSVEAAHGPLKIHTEHQAALAGRPGEWVSGDLAIAREQANQLLRRRGPNGPTPHDLWQQRPPITERQRQRFTAAVDYFRRQLGLTTRHEPDAGPLTATVISARPQGAGLSVCTKRSRSSRGALQRRAIVNALTACGLLHIRRRPFTLPVTSEKTADITYGVQR